MTLGELLRPRELSVIRGAMWSRSIGVADFLVPDGNKKSAERMIARGFLTKTRDLPWLGDSPDPGLVVSITEANVAAINAALANPVQ